jgi:hypothetical protein
MYPKSTREKYEQAYRYLRTLSGKRGESIHVSVAKASALGDLITDVYSTAGVRAIMSFNHRQDDQWRLTRYRHRLQAAAWDKAHSHPFLLKKAVQA